MKKTIKIFLLILFITCIVGDSIAQKKKTKKVSTSQRFKTKKKQTSTKKKISTTKSKKNVKPSTKNNIKAITAVKNESLPDTSASKIVVITSAFKPSLQYAAKINFTAATEVVDITKVPISYKVPSSNLFFSYQPIAIQPLALPADSVKGWINNQRIKIGAGNLNTIYGEGKFSFGDGKKSITSIQADYLSSKSTLFAQQYSKLNLDLLSILNSSNDFEWTAHAFFNSITQYKFGFKPSTLNYSKDQLKQTYNTVALEVGLKNKQVNESGINFHPQLSYYRFTDNNSSSENNLILKAPIEKELTKLLSFKLAFDVDIANINLQTTPSRNITNNLFSINPVVVFTTPNIKLNIGLRPSWDNTVYSMLPDITAESKLKNTNISLEAGWIGYFNKNNWRSLIAFNPWIGSFSTILNTKIREQFIGVKGVAGNHISFNSRLSFIKMDNQPLFLNDAIDGKSFVTLYEPTMNALKLHGEFGYTVQENLSFLASATFTQYNALSINSEAWGLVPLEITASTLWKPIKDLQIKADLFYLGGSMYKTATTPISRLSPGLDLNIGGEFSVKKNLNIWLQMNNLFNNTYQRWNQYPVFGFNVLAGVVYSFK